MTVCITGITDNDQTIISVTDQMLGAGLMTADLPMMLKGKRICDHWSASYAANDVALVPPIISKVENRLRELVSNAAADVAGVFATTYQEERARVAEETVLSPLGLNMKSFLELLMAESSPELADLQRRIQMMQFDPVFLASGFDDRGIPHILTIEPPGTARYYDGVGFWSIGSGAEAALSNLFYRRYTVHESWQVSLYKIAEAKFMSESSSYVGRNSLFTIIRKDRTWAMLLGSFVEPLRKIWEEEGRAPLPNNLDERITQIVTNDFFHPMSELGNQESQRGSDSDES